MPFDGKHSISCCVKMDVHVLVFVFEPEFGLAAAVFICYIP